MDGMTATDPVPVPEQSERKALAEVLAQHEPMSDERGEVVRCSCGVPFGIQHRGNGSFGSHRLDAIIAARHPRPATVSEEAVEAMARARYERYDSHFSMPGGLSWEEYRADDPEGADALYVTEARMDLTAALPHLAVQSEAEVREWLDAHVLADVMDDHRPLPGRLSPENVICSCDYTEWERPDWRVHVATAQLVAIREEGHAATSPAPTPPRPERDVAAEALERLADRWRDDADTTLRGMAAKVSRDHSHELRNLARSSAGDPTEGGA